jgi:hypothetical protein
MLKTSSIPWEHNLEHALDMAKNSGKFVLLDVFNPG